MKDHKNLLTEKEQEPLYLVHHMHHFKSGKEVLHELHHCFLFTQKNMKGDKYRIKHSISGGKLIHILDKIYSGKLYDHANRVFNIKAKKINGKNYSVIQ